MFQWQVDTENETMRMRESWEVWLLPNQATGKQGVPRYIKVDPATVSEEAATTSGVDATKPGETPEQVQISDVRCVTPVIVAPQPLPCADFALHGNHADDSSQSRSGVEFFSSFSSVLTQIRAK